MLGQLAVPHGTVVADFEAGLGTVLRLEAGSLDMVVVVAEPTAKSLDVARRAAQTVRERGLGEVVVTANRIRDDGDVARVRAAFPGPDVVLVPDEPAIVSAERRGEAPLDVAADSAGVRALVGLTQAVLAFDRG